MKFIRRHDLEPHTRIEIVRLAWINQGLYGKMIQIAQDYHISRTFLYQLTWSAQHQLQELFSDPQHLVQDVHSQFEPLILLLRLAGKCSLPSLSAILKRLEGSVSKVEMATPIDLIYKVLLPSISTFETPPSMS